MLKLRHYLYSLTFSATALIPLTSSADTFHLTDGTTLKGSVVMEKDDEYLLKVEISENILTEKTVKKSMITKIDKDDRSIPAYKKIQSLLPLQDDLTIKDYQDFENVYLQKFRDDYPDSKYTKKIDEISKMVKKEIALLESGGVKINGKNITEEEYAKNKYQYDAQIKLRKLQKAAASKQYTYAMQKFEDLEKSHPQTKAFQKAIQIVQGFLPEYKASVAKLESKVDEEVERRDNALESLEGGDKTRTSRMLLQEANQYETSLAKAEDEQKTKWLPLNKFYKDPARKVLSNISNEENRLSKINFTSKINPSATYREFYSAIEKDDIKEASSRLNDFRSTRPSREYLDEMKTDLDQAKEEVKKEEQRLESEKKAAEAKLKEQQQQEKDDKKKKSK